MVALKGVLFLEGNIMLKGVVVKISGNEWWNVCACAYYDDIINHTKAVRRANYVYREQSFSY